MDEADALAYWFGADKEVFVAAADGAILGTYYLRANQAAGGAPVCNAGSMTSTAPTRRGAARARCLHSIAPATAPGLPAMPSNFFLSRPVRADRPWRPLGFEAVVRSQGGCGHR